MSPAPPPRGVHELALDVQRRLETLYDLHPEAPVTEYLIPPDAVAHLPGGGSRTLVAQDGDEVSVGVVLDEATRRELARADPRVRLDSTSLGPLTTLTEEVSHFLYLLFRARSDRSVTRLELELQAEVDKYLVALSFLGRTDGGSASGRLRGLLFEGYRLAEGLSAESAERYHAANGLARRYCRWLEARYLRRPRPGELLREGRRFWRLGQREKLETIAALH